MGKSHPEKTTKKRLQKVNRLKSTRDFKKIFKEGKKIISSHFVLYSLSNKLGNSRLGISISSRNIPLSTRRNRIKRTVREFWRLRKPDYSENKDSVLVAKRGADELPNEDIVKEIDYIFNKNLS